MTPTGRFTTPLRPARPGTTRRSRRLRITPVLSIVTTIPEQEPQSRVTLPRQPDHDSFVSEELADLKDRFADRFAPFHVLSREPVEADLLHGRLDPDKLSTFFDAAAGSRRGRVVPLRAVRHGGREPRAAADRGVEPSHVH
jgi:ring-1,2-phenylacetyl-CoA epoxidase subunit PaaE